MSWQSDLTVFLGIAALVIPTMTAGIIAEWSNGALGTAFLGSMSVGLLLGFAVDHRLHGRDFR